MPPLSFERVFSIKNITILLIVLSFVTLSAATTQHMSTPDFLASWMAGRAWLNGDLQNIYPPLEMGVFDLLAPRSWYDALGADEKDAVYPFVYPPIWAVVFGKLNLVMSYETAHLIANIVNPLLLTGTLFLASRITLSKAPITPVLVIGFALFSISAIGQVALIQNQFQILVSFLILLSVERARRGHEIAGGAALALAASLKIYPAFFIILFWAAGYRKATVAFLVSGVALGLTSIAVAGWPLHERFLETLSVISQTVLVTPLSWSLDVAIGQIFFQEALLKSLSPDWSPLHNLALGDRKIFWFMQKGKIWQICSSLGMVLSLGIGAVLVKRAKRHDANSGWGWAFSFGLFALFSPLSWCYHYITAAAFAPLYVMRIGFARGFIWIGAVIYFTSLLSFGIVELIPRPFIVEQIMGTLSMILLVVSFGYSVYYRH